jgi:hypothetical protein
MGSNDRQTAVRSAILDAVANDYENIDQIVEGVRTMLGSRQSYVTVQDVAEELAALASDQLVATFLLSPSSPQAVPVPFSYEAINDSWFYITPLGKRSLQE